VISFAPTWTGYVRVRLVSLKSTFGELILALNLTSKSLSSLEQSTYKSQVSNAVLGYGNSGGGFGRTEGTAVGFLVETAFVAVDLELRVVVGLETREAIGFGFGFGSDFGFGFALGFGLDGLGPEGLLPLERPLDSTRALREAAGCSLFTSTIFLLESYSVGKQVQCLLLIKHTISLAVY
jgi:hypothetical protein